MSVDDNPGDDAPAPDAFADNVVPFRRERNSRAALPRDDESRDDDELLQLATNTIAKWTTAFNPPSMTEVQNFLYELICNGGSAMLRDRVVAAIVSTFGDGFGGKRALARHGAISLSRLQLSDLSPRVGLVTRQRQTPYS